MPRPFPCLSGAIFIALILNACTPTASPPTARGFSATVFSLNADIEKRDNAMVTMRVQKPPFDTRGRLALKLARGIINDTYLIEGKSTRIGTSELIVERLAGDLVLARIPRGGKEIIPGRTVRIYLRRKTIAITDFTVINSGGNNDISRYVQEEVTTVLVRSGQFRVLEREQLKTVLRELSLSQSGLVDQAGAKKVGKLLGADLILTGSLTRTGDRWHANLRLINTETGLILTAINQSGPLAEASREQLRDLADINATFEVGEKLTGWDLGKRQGGRRGEKGFMGVYVDPENGANLSRQSLAMDFTLGVNRVENLRKKKMFVAIRNNRKRDLSMFRGRKFRLRASRPLTVRFVLYDSEKGSPAEENWRQDIGEKKLAKGSNRFQRPCPRPQKSATVRDQSGNGSGPDRENGLAGKRIRQSAGNQRHHLAG